MDSNPTTTGAEPSRRKAIAASIAIPAGVFAVVASVAVGPTDSIPDAPAASATTGLTTTAQLLADTATIAAPPAELVAAEEPVVEPPAAAPAPTPPRPEGLPSDVRQGGIPEINYAAYTHAAELLAEAQPQCGIGWTLIAGIGRVESTHANNGAAAEDGNLLTPILGPVLDGSLAGNAVIRDTDGGELDGNASYDRAVGPTQFLPATWKAYATDGNGDGFADPQNLYDAAATTGNYLCHGNLDLRTAGDTARAVLRYNNSQAYVNDVVGYASQYAAH